MQFAFPAPLMLLMMSVLLLLITKNIVAIGGKVPQAQPFAWMADFILYSMLQTVISRLKGRAITKNSLICAEFACIVVSVRFIFVKHAMFHYA
jgi:hypothetical protein